MSVTNFWEGEPRDDHGKWTSGGSSSSDKTQSIESLREKLEQETWPVMRSARGNYDAWFPPPASVTVGHLDRMATLLHSWSQADHWGDSAFRDHFLSQLHRQDLSNGLRGSARALRDAKTPQDQAAAGKDLSAQIRLYNPEHWVADLPILQQRADSALSLGGPPESLKAYGPVTEITNFEYAGRKAQLLRKSLPPGYEPIQKNAQGCPSPPSWPASPPAVAVPPAAPVPIASPGQNALSSTTSKTGPLPFPLPKDPNDLITQHGYIDTSHPSAAASGRLKFENPGTGDVLEFDRSKPGDTGFGGVDHYHRQNPNRTSKKDKYLDKNGNPVKEHSKHSHLVP